MTKGNTDENGHVPYTALPDSDDPEVEETPPLLSMSRIVLMNMTHFGINFNAILFTVIVIPAQMEALVDSSSKGTAFGGLLASGAVVTFGMSPLVGLVSDRLRLKMGRRRPLMLVGIVIFSFGVLGMALSAPTLTVDAMKEETNITGMDSTDDSGQCHRDLVAKRCQPFWNSSVLPEDFATNGSGSDLDEGALLLAEPPEPSSKAYIGLYLVCYLVSMASLAIISVPFSALVADKSHPTQRGFNSGVLATMNLLGCVAGAVVGMIFTSIGVICTYVLIVVVVVVCVIITVISTPETPRTEESEKKAVGCGIIFASFWSPLKEHDFRWIFITRFLMQQGHSTILGFLEYWFDEMIQLPLCWTAATAVGVSLTPLLLSATISALFFGILSDRTGKRKPIVSIAAFVMAASVLTNAFLTDDMDYAYYVALFLAVSIGMGYGAFLSVDFALVMDVLMDATENAKDIAVWHQALVLPQALATPVGGLILDLFERVNCEVGLGYIVLFVITSVYFLLSGIFVYKIRRAQ